MFTLDPTREQLKAFLTQYPDNQPVCMINFIKFKTKVEGSDLTGEEQYKIYGEKAQPFFEKVGGKIIFRGNPTMYLIGNEADTHWDLVLIAWYPHKNAFYEMVKMEGYPAELRTKALVDSKLIPSMPLNNVHF
jgi:uncharacterized protein (DUF1330 family)